MHVAISGLFRAKWTDRIHDEWIRNLLSDRPDITAEQLQTTRQLMNAHVPDCLVTGYEALIPAVALPDPNDQHILAAAVRAGADVILTFNLRDFPKETIRPLGIEVQHPDVFLAKQLEVAPLIMCAAAKQHRLSLKNPAKTIDEHLETLQSVGLPQTVVSLRVFAEFI